MNLFEVSGAEFSKCRNYRYVLYRIWDKEKPKIIFIGLNPSTANETTDDPTIRRVKRFAREWGYGGVYMMNLFAWVTAYPDELVKCPDPIADNDYWLKKMAHLSKDVLFAWGSFSEAKERAKQVIEMFPNAVCLGLTKDGSPKHPLYIAAKTTPVAYDSPGFYGCNSDEFGMFEAGSVKLPLPKDYMRIKKIKILNPDGTTSKLKLKKSKKKKK